MTLRVRSGLPSLRKLLPHGALLRAFQAGCEKPGFRVAHYSVQTNHIHLIAEGEDRSHLARGIQGLCIRIARALNRLWRRTGSIFADRYHDHVLKTPREVRNALLYVLQNCRHHGDLRWWGTSDPRSSGAWFTGWRDTAPTPREIDDRSPVARAKTWLLNIGWRRWGLLRLSESPAT